MSSHPPSRAYVTLACGHPRYLEMAVDLALSLRAFDATPVCLIADGPLAGPARALPGELFAAVATIGSRWGGRLRKFSVASVVPLHEEIVFVDADCLALADPAPIWGGASAASVTMVGEVLGPRDRAYHHGFATQDLMRRLGLSAYLKTNSGVFHVRRAGGAEALAACARCYATELRRLPTRLRPWRFLGDEIAFGVVGGRLGFGTFPAPGPMYWAPEVQTLDPERPTKPILHFIAPVPRRTLEALLEGVRARRRAAGIDPDGSLAAWRWKARRGALSWVANQAIRRLVPRA